MCKILVLLEDGYVVGYCDAESDRKREDAELWKKESLTTRDIQEAIELT